MRSTWSQRFGENAGRLEQHAEQAEGRVELDDEFRLDAKIFGAVAMAFLDAPLGVAAVAAHVPFAGGAGAARHRIGSAHDADDEISGGKPAFRRRGLHPPKRFMAEDQPLLARRRGAILAGNDLPVGPAHAERHRATSTAPSARRGLGDILQAGRIANSRRHCQCAQFVTIW